MPNPPSTGLPHPASYAVPSPGVVLDKVTSLMWQRNVDADHHTWKAAIDHCDRLILAGFTDWRLPSRIELVSILDLSQTEPAINRSVFPETPTDWFWTSSVEAANPDGAAWNVYFFFGHAKVDPTNSPYRARCVRTAATSSPPPSPAPAYDIRKAVVVDRGTGLTWQRSVPKRSFTFQEARQYCAALPRADLEFPHAEPKPRWRLPALGELLTLVDERTSRPAIDGQAFPDTPNESFWTSSVFADTQAMAWNVYFEYGNTLHDLIKATFRVRCVY